MPLSVMMQPRFFLGPRTMPVRIAGLCFTLEFLVACVGPQSMGPSRSGIPGPSPNSLANRGMLTPRATLGQGAAETTTSTPTVSLLPDTTQAGAPWSGLQLAPQVYSRGVFVGIVSRGSPAALAGIQPGDYIFQLEGHAVADAQDVMSAVDQAGIGGTLHVGVHRAGKVRIFRIEPVARPAVEDDGAERAKLDPSPSENPSNPSPSSNRY